MKTNKIIGLTLGLSLALTLSAHAKDKARDNEKKNSKGSDSAEHAQGGDRAERDGDHGKKGEVTITASEREVIRAFVEQRSERPGQKAKRLPPGLAKKVARGGKLPPGWEKKLRPGEIVTPEIWSESHPLPREIIVKLPPPPVGTILIAVEGKVARVLEKTRQILDVFDVLPHP